MPIAHNLGFPRIGPKRETKKTVEAYWRGEITRQELVTHQRQLQAQNWQLQSSAGLDLIPVGDFSWYDHVLDTAILFGVVPARFTRDKKTVDIDTLFFMARGQSLDGQQTTACEMTKWFNTNYHCIVPEFSPQQTFELTLQTLFDDIDHALKLKYKVKPVLLGPLTFLWLGKCKEQTFDKLSLLDKLLPAYEAIFAKLAQRGIQWVQIDEPILVLDLPAEWRAAVTTVYNRLNFSGVKNLLTTYFGHLGDNLTLACQLPVDGLHIDACHASEQIDSVLEQLPPEKVLSVGIIDGRNIWKNDLNASLVLLKKIHAAKGDNLWIAASSSLLHVPIDLDLEEKLAAELKNWLAFAKQKIVEIVTLKQALHKNDKNTAVRLQENAAACATRKTSMRIHNPNVKQRMVQYRAELAQRASEYPQRHIAQSNVLKLPVLPTTTIGSFPQTAAIRTIRRDFKSGKIDVVIYEEKIRAQITEVIRIQEELGLDVLVHGEAERNDMVEYFGELLAGFAFTTHGWVQSYGSRCVKPPIIYGDVSRSHPMTVAWSSFAQSLTTKPVKGMLTGPVTILAWSFVRDDQPRQDTALQIAFALRDEVVDLEAAGISIIQIDEPAFRESLPLRQTDRQPYLTWAVNCFRVAASGVKDETQIHTHMCYSEFNDIINAIAALDADVITLESSRSAMELLQAFEHFAYPNEIGPGVYDVHSPRIPTVAEIEDLLRSALRYIPHERLWVNPDCGLKTRNWDEVRAALINMVQAAHNLRQSVLSSRDARTQITTESSI